MEVNNKLNPIQGLNEIYEKIIKGTIIKYSYLADAYEKLTEDLFDSSVIAFYNHDAFEDYDSYTMNEFKIAYCTAYHVTIHDIPYSDAAILQMVEHPETIPEELQPYVLDARRTALAKSEFENGGTPTVEMRKYVDTYIDAVNEVDKYTSYTYTKSEIKQAYIDVFATDIDEETLAEWLNNQSSVSATVKDTLLRNRRDWIKLTYDEKNDYYRMINGKPSINDTSVERLYVTYDQCEKYGLDPMVFTYSGLSIDEIEDYYNRNSDSNLGTHYINMLETSGCLDEIRDYIFNNASSPESYKDKFEYTKYIGSKRIPILTARSALNFDLLYIDPNITNVIRSRFINLYEHAREYFMTAIYIYDYRNVIDYYDRFIGLCIMLMALQQLTARTMEMAFNRDFFDIHSVRSLYEEYDIPYFVNLPLSIQYTICQNINMLVQDKGTNHVIYNLGNLLGFNDLEIYRYYIMKEHLFNFDGTPKFSPIIEYYVFADWNYKNYLGWMAYNSSNNTFTKITEENANYYIQQAILSPNGKIPMWKMEMNPETGEYTYAYNWKEMYDVYFQKVNVANKDYHESLENPANRVSYLSITEPDPFWIEDADTETEVWENEYNYKETKYLGITISYKLSELLYSNIALIRMIFDIKDSLGTIMIKPLTITDDGTNVSVFDSFVMLCALLSKKAKMEGDIITSPSKTIAVLSDLYSEEDLSLYFIEHGDSEEVRTELLENSDFDHNTFAFNFDWIKSDDAGETIEMMREYIPEEDITELLSYLEILNIPDVDNTSKIELINKMFSNIKGLSRFLSEKMVRSKTIYEYRLYQRFYKAAFYSTQTNEMFTIVDGSGVTRPAETFLEYLEYSSPKAAELINNTEPDDCHIYIDYIINQLEAALDDNNPDTDFNFEALHNINRSTSVLQEVLLTLVKFFKSYTTDLVSLDIKYIFDFKPENILILIDEMHELRKTLELKDPLKFSYADSVNYIKAKETVDDKLIFLEKMYIKATFDVKDKFNLSDDIFIHKIIELTDHLDQSIHLNDDIFIHAHLTLDEYLNKLRDAVVFITKDIALKEVFTLIDEISVHKEVPIRENFGLYDTCTVIRDTRYNISVDGKNIILEDSYGNTDTESINNFDNELTLDNFKIATSVDDDGEDLMEIGFF